MNTKSRTNAHPSPEPIVDLTEAAVPESRYGSDSPLDLILAPFTDAAWTGERPTDYKIESSAPATHLIDAEWDLAEEPHVTLHVAPRIVPTPIITVRTAA